MEISMIYLDPRVRFSYASYYIYGLEAFRTF